MEVVYSLYFCSKKMFSAREELFRLVRLYVRIRYLEGSYLGFINA